MMVQKASIYLTTYNQDRNKWMNHQERLLREYYQLSDKRYALVNDPDKADIILIVDVWENVWEGGGLPAWVDNVGNHPLIKKYPDKSFSISDMAAPVILHHGLYINGEKGIFSAGRVCTGGYTLFFDKLVNPFFENYMPGADTDAEKPYLFSFIGRQSHPIRAKIFKLKFERNDILVQDSSKFDFFGKAIDQRQERQKYYFDKLLQSKFSLCPRGLGANSLRLFESMQLSVAPVIISDAWIYPRGIRWSDFSIIVKEKNVKDLEKIIASYESSYKEMGRLARKAYDENFRKDVYFNFVVENCIYLRDTQRIPESFYQLINPFYTRFIKMKDKLRLRSRARKLGQALQQKLPF